MGFSQRNRSARLRLAHLSQGARLARRRFSAGFAASGAPVNAKKALYCFAVTVNSVWSSSSCSAFSRERLPA